MGFLSDLFGGKRPEIGAKSLFDLFPEMRQQYEELAGLPEGTTLFGSYGDLASAFTEGRDEALGFLTEGFDQLQGLLGGVETDFATDFSNLLSGFQTSFDAARSFADQAISQYQTTGIDSALQLRQQAGDRQQRMLQQQLAGMGLTGSSVGAGALGSIQQQTALDMGAMQEDFGARLAQMMQNRANLEMQGSQFQAGLGQFGASNMMNLGLGRAGALSDYTQSRIGLFNQYQQSIMDAREQQFMQPLSLLTGMITGGYRNPTVFNAAKQGGIGAQLAGQAAGAGMAALFSSDIRLKTNLVPIGERYGLTIYKWDWNKIARRFGLEGESRGFIAQEVEVLHPEVIFEHDGFKKISYRMLFEKFEDIDSMEDIEYDKQALETCEYEEATHG